MPQWSSFHNQQPLVASPAVTGNGIHAPSSTPASYPIACGTPQGLWQDFASDCPSHISIARFLRKK